MVVSLNGRKVLNNTGTTDPEGNAAISFDLPKELTTNDGLLNVTIQYEGNTESISRSIPIVLNNISLTFFPEGGELLRGYENTCAFKALDEFGKPADIDGTVFDKDNNEICSFSSYHQGMGAFRFKPEYGAYYAKITRPSGIERKYNLPNPLKSGYLLHIENQVEESLSVKIISPRKENLTLTGLIRGKMVYSKPMHLAEGENNIKIPTGEFPAGILQLTLFDKYDIPRCERLIFVNKNKELKVRITPSKKEYLPREKVELKIETFDKDSIPLPAQLSLAVVNDKVISFADDKQDNILSCLHLTSDLKGDIEEPMFYFDEQEEKADTALDYLLLTHGWRRFTWEEIMAEDYQVKHYPEKVRSVSGVVKHKTSGAPLQAVVTLLEISGEQRAAQVSTLADGKFLFQNIDPSATKKMIVRAPGVRANNIEVQLHDLDFNGIKGFQTASTTDKLVPVVIKEKIEEKDEVEIENEPIEQNVDRKKNRNDKNVNTEQNIDAFLTPDVANLEEIVLVGYGTQKKSDLTGAVVRISEPQKIQGTNIEHMLQGRLAGVLITDHAPGTGEAANIEIRGTNTVASSEPLFIVDGIPVSSLPDSKLSPIGHLSPGDIESIEVLKDASTTAIYGSRAANGVIVIQTKKLVPSYNQRTFYPKKRYNVIDVPAKSFSRVREFYCPVYKKSDKIDERSDFRTTIYWNPDIKTDKKGSTTVSFYNSDEITTFRAIAEGLGIKGLVGRTEATYFTQLPFTIETKIPPYLTYGDIVEIPILLKNNTDEEIKGKFQIEVPAVLKIIDSIPTHVTLDANGNKTIILKCNVLSVKGKFNLKIGFKAKGLKDNVRKEIEVQPKGFPVEATISGNELDKQYILMVSDPLEGSLNAKFTAFPDVTSDLLSGIESILREPYGCFEQTSSSTYPNIMVLSYLEETGTVNPKLYKKALDLIDRGYKRLISFETNSKGYEWFGQAPAHESLTAYGLMEFVDMEKVYDKVDKQMLQRTTKWIDSRRDGKGNFKLNDHALDQFGRASQEVVNAYVVYALSEAGFDKLDTEYEKAYSEALQSKDPYRVSLMACASFNLGKNSNGQKLLDIMQQKLVKNDFETIAIDHSITKSYGKSLKIETASIYLMALLKTNQVSIQNVKEVSDYIINSRCGGGFGSTQATILALKALTEFAKFSKQTSTGGTIELYINGKLHASKHYEAGHVGEVAFDSLQKRLKKGANSIHIKFKDTKEALPYSLDASWTSMTPNSSKECVIDLKTRLDKPEAKVGETVRLTSTLINTSQKGQPMTIALIGIPAGLSAQPWQLKELSEKKVFDYYEIRKNYVVVYYRDMKPSEKHIIHLDLKAEVPGTYMAPASSGYLYYTNEYKDWESGTKVNISLD
jgi:TonB-dependent SusC/RagA subfamily outer membrane receptor